MTHSVSPAPLSLFAVKTVEIVDGSGTASFFQLRPLAALPDFRLAAAGRDRKRLIDFITPSAPAEWRKSIGTLSDSDLLLLARAVMFGEPPKETVSSCGGEIDYDFLAGMVMKEFHWSIEYLFQLPFPAFAALVGVIPRLRAEIALDVVGAGYRAGRLGGAAAAHLEHLRGRRVREPEYHLPEELISRTVTRARRALDNYRNGCREKITSSPV